jgi:class 3 adenylate cyclase
VADLPRGTVTFLFTDIEGSTRLWEQCPEAMTAASGRHDALLRESVAAHGGVLYKMIGDGSQAAFASAPHAIAAALALQSRLAREPWETPGPLRVRMAVHSGVAEPQADGDFRTPDLIAWDACLPLPTAAKCCCRPPRRN